jgi:meiotically up-regulated gene 157 (Mug157) protein
MLENIVIQLTEDIDRLPEEKPALEKLKVMFKNCFVSTFDTTVEFLDDGTAFVFTGDIPAMWLRDSSAQVRHYLPFVNRDENIRKLIRGLIKRQMMYIQKDPYANAFNKEPNNHGHKTDITVQNEWVWERKYEVDSLCYPVQLAYLYWKESNDSSIFDESFKATMKIILDLWKTEQNHNENSPYRFIRENCAQTDTLSHDGRGAPVGYTGMTWSGFRPSDDACTYGYLIPSNMFAVVVLGYMSEIMGKFYGDTILAQEAARMKEEIKNGIETFGIFEHPQYGKIYAYETDGYGNYNLMDDANVPSLLSIPYFGYTTIDDPVYQNTRRFILSSDNPFFYEGKYGKGIGSPHTPKDHIWHIGLIMQGLTSNSKDEMLSILKILINTDAGTNYMHESFHADDPAIYTRSWFAWANSLLAEFIVYFASKNFS